MSAARKAIPLLALAIVSASLASPVGMRYQPSPEKLFTRGVRLLQRGKVDEAVTFFEQLTTDFPRQYLYWKGLGFIATVKGDEPRAISCWKRCLELDATNWRIRAELVQSYQATGDLAARDRELAALVSFRASALGSDITEVGGFYRDRFFVGAVFVRGIQYFDEAGQGELYRFLVSDQDLNELIAFPFRSFRFPDDGSQYHCLCEKEGEEVRGLTLFRTRPSYDDLRCHVQRLLLQEGRGASTEEERDLLLTIVPQLAAQPFGTRAHLCRTWGARLLTHVPDISVSVEASALAPIVESAYAHKTIMVAQYILASGEFVIRRGGTTGGHHEEQTFHALRSCLKAYESILKRAPEDRLEFFDHLQEALDNGSFETRVRDMLSPGE